MCSVGIISLVCLNLPLQERHKSENMFLAGIIPGPSEPPLDCISHYLTPLVDHLLLLWDGLHFSRTHNHSEGRIVRAAVVLAVCDLPMARKIGGFGGHNHDCICHICECWWESGKGYGNFEPWTWRKRTNEKVREQASAWAASSTKVREKLFASNGVRRSELSCLPYFDMCRCIVVDPMHNLFLGLLKTHFLEILGIGLKAPKLNVFFDLPLLSSAASSLSTKDQGEVARIRTVLEKEFTALSVLQKSLSRRSRVALLHVCMTLQCPTSHILTENLEAKNPDCFNQIELADCIARWVRLVSHVSLSRSPVPSARHKPR